MEINKVEFMLEVLLLAQGLGLCYCQVPTVIELPSYITCSEDFPLGSLLLTFNVTVEKPDEDIVIRIQGSETSDIVYLNQTRGSNIFVQVFTKTVLDRDGYGIPGKGVADLRFLVMDLRGNVINIKTTLYLFDINDNTPQLQKRPYTWNINEYFHNENETYNNVTAIDFDNGINGTLGIRYKMEPIAESSFLVSEYRATFTMNASTGEITLQHALDFETHNIYHFNVTATDENGNGRTSEATLLTITVLDVKDTPPVFTSASYKAFLRNNAAINTLVISVHAIDGDIGYWPLNAVQYSIAPGQCSEFFSINSHGEIHTKQSINTNLEAFEPLCELTVTAQEIDVDPSKQYGPTQTNATVYMILEESHHGNCSGGA